MHRRTRYSDKKAHRVHAGGLEVLWTRSTHGTSQGSIRRGLSATLLPANLDPNPITASRRQALTAASFDGRPHARRRAAPSLRTAAMASALAMPPILAPSSIASCTGRACLARARRPMTPTRSRTTAIPWAPVHPAPRLRMSVALALTHRPPWPTFARPWRAPGRRMCGHRPASGSFRPRRCASPSPGSTQPA